MRAAIAAVAVAAAVAVGRGHRLRWACLASSSSPCSQRCCPRTLLPGKPSTGSSAPGAPPPPCHRARPFPGPRPCRFPRWSWPLPSPSPARSPGRRGSGSLERTARARPCLIGVPALLLAGWIAGWSVGEHGRGSRLCPGRGEIQTHGDLCREGLQSGRWAELGRARWVLGSRGDGGEGRSDSCSEASPEVDGKYRA